MSYTAAYTGNETRAILTIVFSPHNTTLANKTISPKRYDDGVSRTSSPQVTTDDGPARDDSLTAKNDILRSRNCCTTRNFVTGILSIRDSRSGDVVFTGEGMRRIPTVSMYSFFA